MASLDVSELVSMAESEGITLAEMISRTLTPGQMDKMQGDLCVELADNYCRIEPFMRDVKVQSLEELMASEYVEAPSPANRGPAFA